MKSETVHSGMPVLRGAMVSEDGRGKGMFDIDAATYKWVVHGRPWAGRPAEERTPAICSPDTSPPATPARRSPALHANWLRISPRFPRRLTDQALERTTVHTTPRKHTPRPLFAACIATDGAICLYAICVELRLGYGGQYGSFTCTYFCRA